MPEAPYLDTMLELDQGIRAEMNRLWEHHRTDEFGQRQQYRRAVDAHLDAVIAALKDSGFGNAGPKKKQRRRIDTDVWEKLGKASEEVDVSRPSLLRACLRLALLHKPTKTKKRKKEKATATPSFGAVGKRKLRL